MGRVQSSLRVEAGYANFLRLSRGEVITLKIKKG